MNPTEHHLFETLRGLLPSSCRIMVEGPDSSPEGNLWSVWVDDEIVGAGAARSEALAEAVSQARIWDEAAS